MEPYEPQDPSASLEMEEELSESSSDEAGRRGKQHATLYDAVAGKILNTEQDRNEKRRGPVIVKHSAKEAPMAPDEVLFRRRGAPERYAEHDIYYAHERDLPREGRGILPDSDMLKAVHSYASQFYGAAHQLDQRRGKPNDRNVDERSMDETALLAFGVLLEEAGREVLGRRGDLVFTEAAEEPDASNSDRGLRPSASPRAVAVGRREVGSRISTRKRRRVQTKSETPGRGHSDDDEPMVDD